MGPFHEYLLALNGWRLRFIIYVFNIATFPRGEKAYSWDGQNLGITRIYSCNGYPLGYAHRYCTRQYDSPEYDV